MRISSAVHPVTDAQMAKDFQLAIPRATYQETIPVWLVRCSLILMESEETLAHAR